MSSQTHPDRVIREQCVTRAPRRAPRVWVAGESQDVPAHRQEVNTLSNDFCLIQSIRVRPEARGVYVSHTQPTQETRC